MRAPQTHIVGAGIAGLSAALAASRDGRHAILYEAAAQAGGRCRTLSRSSGFTHDNGTHVLFTGNHRALSFLDEIGARADWIEPEPDGFPIYDAERGQLIRIGLSPWSWWDRDLRPDSLSIGDIARLLRLCLPLPDKPVGALMGSRRIADALIEPLTLAVLNTPVVAASSRRLGAALRRLAWPGAARLLIARAGLSANLVDPALQVLRGRGVEFEAGRRLRALAFDESGASALDFAERRVPLGPEDQVVLALPPWEIARLLPNLPVPDAFEPILNVHIPVRGPSRPHFLGLLGTLAQWALVREDHVSVTVSAAGRGAEEDASALVLRIWGEVASALVARGLSTGAPDLAEARVIKEKRATIRQAAGRLALPPIRPLSNLALAGDWMGSLPATIESAVVSGERAIRALTRQEFAPSRLVRTRAMVPTGAAP